MGAAGTGWSRPCWLMLSARPARSADCRRLFDWRNDPQVRAAAFNTEPVPWDSHRHWLQTRLEDADCRLYVLERGAVPIGQVRFDLQDSTATVNYSLAAEFRGQGLAAPMLATAIAQLIVDVPAVTRLSAYVKTDNPASSRVFDRLKFALDGFDTTRLAHHYAYDVAAGPPRIE